jgi:BirA family biotin operon repressor/biotin-[acetyl-CoA-carboxylase] ligase
MMWNRHDYAELLSTQDQAWALMQEASPTPFVVTAKKQTRGRGRLQREWAFEEGRSMALSLGLRWQSQNFAGLSLAVGLAVAGAIDRLDLCLKWPNDLMQNDQKVGGILIESRSQGGQLIVVIGIGLNFFDLQSSGFKGIGAVIDVDAILNSVERMLKIFESTGFKSFRADYERRLWRRGRSVAYLVGDQKFEGEILGVDDEGRLCLRSGEQMTLKVDGELSLE